MTVIANPKDSLKTDLFSVWFTGNGALKKGMGVCHDRSFVSTKAGQLEDDPFAGRSTRVAVPASGNNGAFAGVAAEDYKAVTGGQLIRIYLPGSDCLVAIGANVMLDTGILTLSAGGGDAGIFSRAGLPGRGSIVPLQRKSPILVNVHDGSGSITGATLTDAAAFANVEAGDIVYLVGGGVAATGVADATGIYGKYLVASKTDVNTLVLAAAPNEDNATSAAPNFTSATAVSYTIMSGQAMCLAHLMDGDESGCQEWLDVDDTATVDAMPHGMTYVGGGAQTAGASQDVAVVAQLPGTLKAFRIPKEATTNPQTLTEKAGVTLLQMDGTAYAALTVAADADHAAFEFGALGSIAKTVATDMTES